jgi:hypothetical protein
MRFAFTGSQEGMTPAARRSLAVVLRDDEVTELHHGDCVGSDAIAGSVAQALGLRVVLHPPTDERKRAFSGGDDWREPKPYLVRNHEMVDECEALVATPRGPERLRSGTWATVRYARKQGRPVVLIKPNGSVVLERAGVR